jgi:hypothetical protein
MAMKSAPDLDRYMRMTAFERRVLIDEVNQCIEEQNATDD